VIRLINLLIPFGSWPMIQKGSLARLVDVHVDPREEVMAGADSRPLCYSERRSFLGGSDARIIMGDDQNALIRLWHEKRGEAEPEDLSSNLIVSSAPPPRN
jgi:hypothetical protein